MRKRPNTTFKIHSTKWAANWSSYACLAYGQHNYSCSVKGSSQQRMVMERHGVRCTKRWAEERRRRHRVDGAGTEMQFGFFALGLQSKGVPFDHQHNLKFPVLHCYIPTILYHIYYNILYHYILSGPGKWNLHSKSSTYLCYRANVSDSSP